MGLFVFQCVYESVTNEYVARLITARLLVSLEGKARQGVSCWALKKKKKKKKKKRKERKKERKKDEVEMTTGWREKCYS